MNRPKLLATAFATAVFSISSSYADDNKVAMEKCKPVDNKGNNIVKEHMSDCAGHSSSCAGHNETGDTDAWILVPKGDCEKINKGNFSGLSQNTLDKLDLKQKQ